MEDLEETLYVYPWKGILANIKRTFNETKNTYDGENGSKLREDLVSKGFNPQKVQPLWESGVGHTGFAIVVFGKEWDGFRNARNFEKHFEVNQCGKSDYDTAGERGDKLYGWIAKKEDFHSRTVIGDHLKKQGDLQTVSGIEEEERTKKSVFATYLKSILETKDAEIQQMESIFKENSMAVEMAKAQIEEAKKKEVEEQEKHVDKCRKLNKAEGRKIQIQKAIEEQKKADEAIMKLVEQQKKEKDELRKEMCEVLQKVDAEKALELGIVRLSGDLEVLKQMEESGVEEEALRPEIEVVMRDALEVLRSLG